MPAPKNSVVIRGVGRCNQSPRSRGGGANLAPASEPRRGAVGRARSRVRIGPAPPVTIAHFSFVGLKKMRCGDRPTRTTVALHPSPDGGTTRRGRPDTALGAQRRRKVCRSAVKSPCTCRKPRPRSPPLGVMDIPPSLTAALVAQARRDRRASKEVISLKISG
jgi:hypothetical protein